MSVPVVPLGEDFPLSDEHRSAALEGAADHVRDVDDLGRRADGYFDGDYPPTFFAFMQAMMRETWRDEQGSYAKWDKVARAGGVYTIGKTIL